MLETVDELVKQQRLDICHDCESYSSKLNSCKQCGCYLPAKTAFANTNCPIGKWTAASAGTSLINKLEESILNLWDKQ